MSNRYQKPFCLIAIISLLMAILPLPYGYYVLLRIVITIAAGYMAYVSHVLNSKPFTYVFAVIVILFNPIIKIPLDKSIWMIADIITAVIFFIALRKAKRTI